MKKLTIAMLLTMLGAGAMAQNFEGSTVEERIAHSTGNNEDSVKTAKGYITMFQQAGANKDYADMYINYKWLKNYAPFAVNGIYTQGPFMFYNLINAEQDPVKKRRYFDEMMELFELRQKKGMTVEKATELLLKSYTYYGVMMVKMGDADGMVSGACHSTADTLRPSLQILKTAPGTKLVSSFFLMNVPDCEFGNHGTFVFSDCGLNQNPTAEELAAIAKSSADSYRSLTGDEPKVAMLSYSSKGSPSLYQLIFAPFFCSIL